MLVKLGGSARDVIPVQPWNAVPILLKLRGSESEVIPLQPLNELPSILCKLSESVREVSPMQFWNALLPTRVTEFGSLSDVSLTQPENA